MYNRYIPQPDGSFRRNRVNEPTPRPKTHEKEERKEQPCEPPKKDPPCEPPKQEIPCPPPKQEHHHNHDKPHKKDDSITGFLQNLLPKDLDTGDLIVILLLLLLAGDCEEDRSNALLTLALYLFM